jgi:hypothetical protein
MKKCNAFVSFLIQSIKLEFAEFSSWAYDTINAVCFSVRRNPLPVLESNFAFYLDRRLAE